MSQGKAIEGAEAPATTALDDQVPVELLGWRPPGGVFSVYVRIEPGDRAGRSRIELRDDLDRAIGEADCDGDAHHDLERLAARIEKEADLIAQQASGRGIIAFVEARKSGEERWYTTQTPPRRTEAHLGAGATLAPLLALLRDGSPAGVAVVSSECVRLFDWRLGRLEQLHDWELNVFSLDWRERKAPGPRNPAAGSGASAAGHDQYQQRLDHNRERFGREAGELACREAADRRWEKVLVFGDERCAAPFAEGFGNGEVALRHVDQHDLVSQPTHSIAERVEGVVLAVHRDRDRELVEGLKESGFAGGRAALGPQETEQSLEQGRVERLVYDARLSGPEVERLIELAASSGAAAVPVEGAAAAALSEQDGVAALLRY